MLQQAPERDVVDAVAADGLEAARGLQRAPAHQHAPPGRGGGARTGPVDPPERVELGEKIHERGHQQPLPAGVGPQQRHLRDHPAVVGLGRPHQRGEGPGLVGDVGVREQDVRGVTRGP